MGIPDYGKWISPSDFPEGKEQLGTDFGLDSGEQMKVAAAFCFYFGGLWGPNP